MLHFPIDLRMGRLKFVRTSKFWKLPAQLAGNDFGQSFTPDPKVLGWIRLYKWDTFET